MKPSTYKINVTPRLEKLATPEYGVSKYVTDTGKKPMVNLELNISVKKLFQFLIKIISHLSVQSTIFSVITNM